MSSRSRASGAAGSGSWVEERITGLLDSDDAPLALRSGLTVRNQSMFYDRFDAVVLLSAPARRDP